jgi:hypothetical protein
VRQRSRDGGTEEGKERYWRKLWWGARDVGGRDSCGGRRPEDAATAVGRYVAGLQKGLRS